MSEIAAGGFGHTYKAIDIGFPEPQYCVVKHLHPQNQDEQSLEIAKRLFETEAKVLFRLGKNDGIPELYAYFEEEGEFYLVQELIEGQDLQQEFQVNQRWSESETVSFLEELLAILSEVHKQDTVHRDIKPANIMRRDKDGKLVLIDFGAVKEIITVDEIGNTKLPIKTIGIGTPAYMPAEQVMGQPGTYSDIYAVGMLGIQALTGLPSMDLPRDEEQLEEVFREKQIKIASELKSVLSRMIAYQPKARYSNAQKALAAFKPSVVLSEPPKPDPKRGFLKKIIFGGLPLTALIGIIGYYAIQFISKPNYTHLETYLKNKEWQKANTETNKLLLEIANEKNALDADSISKFPCEDLDKIDKLWTSHSDGRFGFTPQKKAYVETDNEFNQYIQSNYEEFGNRVGWRIFGAWKKYQDLNFKKIDTNISPSGYLPTPAKVADERQDLRIREPEMLLSRFNSCNL